MENANFEISPTSRELLLADVLVDEFSGDDSEFEKFTYVNKTEAIFFEVYMQEFLS